MTTFFTILPQQWTKSFDEDQKLLILKLDYGPHGLPMLGFEIKSLLDQKLLTVGHLYQLNETTAADALINNLSTRLLAFVLNSTIGADAADIIMHDIWWENFVIGKHGSIAHKAFVEFFPKTYLWYSKTIQKPIVKGIP